MDESLLTFTSSVSPYNDNHQYHHKVQITTKLYIAFKISNSFTKVIAFLECTMII